MLSSFKKLNIQANTRDVDENLMDKYPDQLFVRVHLNKHYPADALINLNSPFNFITARLASAMGLVVNPTQQEMTSLSGEVTKYTSKACVNLSVRSSNLKVDNVEVIVLDKSAPCKPEMTLGFDFLRKFEYVSMVFYGDLPKSIFYAPCNCPIEIQPMIADAWIKYAQVYSDYSQSMCSVEFAKSMKLRVGQKPNCPVTCGPYTTDMFTSVDMYAGPGLLKNFKFLVVEDLPVQVMLGTDFLRTHHEVKIMYEGQLPRLQVSDATAKQDKKDNEKLSY